MDTSEIVQLFVYMMGLFGVAASVWMTMRVHIAKLDAQVAELKDVVSNHIPSKLAELSMKLDRLPCQNHLEELVKLTTRLESLTERIERLEQKINGRRVQ